MRRFAGKTEFLAGALVTGFNVWLGVSEITEQAIPANSDGIGYEGGFALAQMTIGRI